MAALLPYLAYARQDRAQRVTSLELEWAGQLLGASGVDEVVCVDVHSGRAGEVMGLRLESLSPAGLLADALPDTLVSCCRALRDAGVRQIGVVATHGLFTGERWRALFSEGVQDIWITDTVLAGNRPRQAHVVLVAPLLAAVLAGGGG